MQGIFLTLECNISGSGVLRNMSQPNGKTKPTSGRRGDFLSSLSSFNLTQLDASLAIKAGVLITVLLIIGVLSNHIGESVLAALGTINVCIPDGAMPVSGWSMISSVYSVDNDSSSLIAAGQNPSYQISTFKSVL